MEKFKLSEVKNVLICEDHLFIQKGIEVALKELLPQCCSIKIVNLGRDAIKAATEFPPDLVFVDLGLPDISGMDVIEGLKKVNSKAKILVVTSCSNPSTLKKVKNLSPLAIIQKSSSEDNLRAALNNLENNNLMTYLDQDTRQLLSEHIEIEFTSKEREVLAEIIQGFSNQKIAERLGCAVTTIRFHRANILGKTGLKSASELMAWHLQGQRKFD